MNDINVRAIRNWVIALAFGITFFNPFVTPVSAAYRCPDNSFVLNIDECTSPPTDLNSYQCDDGSYRASPADCPPPITPTPTPNSGCNGNFLGFPAWFNNLPMENCNIKSPDSTEKLTAFIWTIALNVVQMGLVLVAYISGFFFLYGGWLFILSQGKPEGIAKGKSTMTMALIGLVVSIAAVAIVDFIVSKVIP